MQRKNVIIFFLGFFIISSCKQIDPAVPAIDHEQEISFKVPEGFPSPYYQFEFNTPTKKGFELGRRLFYDPLLSRDNSISCGSCHQQFAAFSHYGHEVSHGVDNLLGTRNTPPLFNLPWQQDLMWDGGVHNLELQPLNPITNPVEMDETMANVLAKLKADPVYPGLFSSAFGSDSITTQRIFRSITQFMGLFTSADSRFDRYEKGEESFSDAEKGGLNIFRLKCEGCHREPLFSDYSFRNNGLDLVFADSGRARISMDPMDMGKFKVPSLRNIEVTGPYMHDGRFETLEEVIEHYRSGIQVTNTIDTLLINGISMTDKERNELIAFLKTLTDTGFLTDKRFSQPPR